MLASFVKACFIFSWIGLWSTSVLAAETIHLQLRWHHQFQFAGYYAAVEKGFYQNAGLNVILDAGSPEKNPVWQVLQGDAEYGVGNAELLLERLRGAPLVALAAIYQHSPSVLLANKNAKADSPHDLIGKTVMMMGSETDADFFAMFYNEGINVASINFIPSSFNIDDLINGNTDAFNSYLTNEPYYLKERGVEFTVINPRNYGIDFYSDILFTSEQEIFDHPQRVKAFRQASIEGWVYAMEHPDEIIELLLKKYQVNKSKQHLEFEAAAMRPLIYPDLIEIGHINPWRFKYMAQTLVEAKMVNDDKALEGFIYSSDINVDKEALWLYGKIVALLVLVAVFVIAALAIAYRSAKKELRLRLAAEDEIKKIAYRDSLTGLDNRHHLFVLADQLLKLAQRERHKLAVCFIDLDNFKSINDTLGHIAGDRVLVQVGKLLRNHIRQSDVAVRFGGDEFVLILNNVKSRQDIAETLASIHSELCKPIPYQGQSLYITASIGVAIFPDDSTNMDALIDLADSEMYRIKTSIKTLKTAN
ncbi:MAG: GGDEF domain-containing protein [Methylobacter sp.]|nr:MAG: GGDEF domain-containing protein [Methylobacter sp.]PPD05008.1 MAG: GGDEF domain-containing protein [Methylobacter sp.]PPD23091.1 MAG: GGDEF domain-containing protein [Methylobacter sp.]PPD32002.1 MAG: GGDEF domain-containing protein [Methylomonas sp.]